MNVYIHIPFCTSICSYCDFCKFVYNQKWVSKYLNALKREVLENYKGELINTIYIGGGTPSCLSINELKELFEIIKILKLSSEYEFTFECNIENITKDKLEFLYDNKVNRLSIGVQTFNENYLKFLNRHHTKNEVINKINFAKEIGFNNISVDLIYALPNQTLNELARDIDECVNLNVEHISTYSLMIEPNTKLFIDKTHEISEDIDRDMYELICDKLTKSGYEHYEISNFCKTNYESKHNLTYWNNKEYYGFGLGASGYINGIRYDNTKSINNYLNHKYLFNSNKLSDAEKIVNEFILGLRKIKGINKVEFYDKYKIDIMSINAVAKLIKENKLIQTDENIFINQNYIYTSNEILIDFI